MKTIRIKHTLLTVKTEDCMLFSIVWLMSCLKISTRNVERYTVRTSYTGHTSPGTVNFWLVRGLSSSKLIGYWARRLFFAENRMWKFQRKKRNSTLISCKHLSVMCVTEGGGRSTFQRALQRVGTRPRNDWHWPFYEYKRSLWRKALMKSHKCPADLTEWVLSASLTSSQPVQSGSTLGIWTEKQVGL